jgi:8-oxo-dGTP diphosphatase
MENQRPMVGVAVIIRKSYDQVLIGLRTSKHANGMWGFPGGHLEFGESFKDCAIRESYEETGLQLEDAKYWWHENVIFPDEGLHYVTIFMVTDWKAGEPERTEPDKCAEWKWVSWAELPQPLMPGIVMLRKEGLNPFRSLRNTMM